MDTQPGATQNQSKDEQPITGSFDQYTLRLIVGAIAIALPLIELYLTKRSIVCESISASFWYTENNSARIVFVGSLFGIAAIMFGYKGTDRKRKHFWIETILAKIASLLAVLTAVYPSKSTDSYQQACGLLNDDEHVSIHIFTSVSLFVILGVFCIIFLLHAHSKLKENERDNHRYIYIRISIYTFCVILMIISMALGLLNGYYEHNHKAQCNPLVFLAELIGLIAFGISWLTASFVIPWFVEPNKRAPFWRHFI